MSSLSTLVSTTYPTLSVKTTNEMLQLGKSILQRTRCIADVCVDMIEIKIQELAQSNFCMPDQEHLSPTMREGR